MRLPPGDPFVEVVKLDPGPAGVAPVTTDRLSLGRHRGQSRQALRWDFFSVMPGTNLQRNTGRHMARPFVQATGGWYGGDACSLVRLHVPQLYRLVLAPRG